MGKRYHIILKTKEIAGDDGITAPLKVCLAVWPGTYQAFSTHILNLQTKGLSEGHYTDKFCAALYDYIERCGKYHVSPEPEIRDETGQLVSICAER